MPSLNEKTIDALLPQTQCELCEHPGCLPYATAIARGEDTIDKCLPGGVDTLNQLSAYTGVDATPYIKAMQAKQKPALTAVIREDECIGCTKCIQACPIDAIIGGAKQMHVILERDCSGCELCLAPCPVDCIDLVPIEPATPAKKQANANRWRQLYNDRQSRLERLAERRANKHAAAKLNQHPSRHSTVGARKQAIADALARTRQKRGDTTT